MARKLETMIGEGDGVLLSDGRSRIFLHPPEPLPDGPGFHHQIDLVGGPFRGSIDAESYVGVGALHAFHTQLVALHETLRGEAKLPHASSNIKISLKGDGLGHIRIQADAAAGDMMDTSLSFTFGIDQTQLPEIIKAVERLFLRSDKHLTAGRELSRRGAYVFWLAA